MQSSNLLSGCYVLINGAKSSEMALLGGNCSEAELSKETHCLSQHLGALNHRVDQLLMCRAVGNTYAL